MSTKCSGCNKPIQSLDFLECYRCQETYDLLCAGTDCETFSRLSQANKECWICPLCTSSRPKNDNTETPIGSPAGQLNSTYNTQDRANTTMDRVNSLRGSRRQLNSPSTNIPCCNNDSRLDILVNEIRSLREDLRDVKEQNLYLKEQLAAIPLSITSSLQDYEKKISIQDVEICELKASITNLKSQLNALEQSQLRNKLEICGVPEAESENLEHAALVLASRVGVDLKADDVDFVGRVGSKRPPSSTNKDVMPRTIVINFLRRSKRDEFLKAAKSRRNLTSDLVAQGTSKKIYINERLTKTNRILFREARSRALQYNFRYCWVKNGAVYLRQAEKKPAIFIQTMLDLDHHLGPAKEEETASSVN